MGKGFNTSGDLITQTSDGRSLDSIWAEMQATMEMFNQPRSNLMSFLTFPVTQPVEDVPQAVLEDFEEATEFGVPKAVRGASFFSLAYSFKWYDLGERFTWRFLSEASAGQVQNVHNMVLEADNRNRFNAVFKTIFNNVNTTADIRSVSYNVYKFYNADGTVPPPYKSSTFAGTHNHYITSGAATIDGQDLVDLENTITEHGYGPPGGGLILMVNKAQAATIKTFRVSTGSPNDFIPAQGQPPFLLPTNTGGIAPPTQVPSSLAGLQVIGQCGNWTIVQEDYIPAGYIFGFASGGVNQARNPIGFREHQNANLRGLKLAKGPNADYPLIDAYYVRGFGTGVRQRGAAAVMQITASGTYTIPTAYQ